MQKENNEIKRMPMLQKIGYGMGDAGCNFCWTFVASFIMIYCTNILGVSAAAIGTIMMMSKILDGITDLFMGRIIDITHSKMGKARFWLFVSTFPLSVSTFVLFNVPAGFTENTKYIYIFIVYTLMGAFFYTMNNIAYSTLTALVTKNPKDRVQMATCRYIAAIAATLFMSTYTMKLVERFGGGQQGWRTVSIIYAVLCFAFLMVPVIAVRELPEEELRDRQEEEKAEMSKNEEISFLKGFLLLLKNKYFLMILMMYLVQSLSGGITGGMGIYFAAYQLGDASLLGKLSMASLLPMVFMLLFVPEITSRFGIRTSAMIGGMIGAAAGVLLLIGGLRGSFLLVLAGLVLRSIGNSPLTGGMNALIAEVDDYSSLKFGHRMTGSMYSCSSVGIKVGTGIGTAVCGFLLDASGFDGKASVQTAAALATINWSYILGYALQSLILVIFLYFLNVEKVNKKLRDRR